MFVLIPFYRKAISYNLPSDDNRQNGWTSSTKLRLFFWQRSSASVLQSIATWGLNEL